MDNDKFVKAILQQMKKQVEDLNRKISDLEFYLSKQSNTSKKEPELLSNLDEYVEFLLLNSHCD